MQPRGQLWFELQRVCDDFRAFSGLDKQEAGQVLVAVLRNLLADEEAALLIDKETRRQGDKET